MAEYTEKDIKTLQNIQTAALKAGKIGRMMILSFAQGYASCAEREKQSAEKDKPTEDKTDDEHTK